MKVGENCKDGGTFSDRCGMRLKVPERDRTAGGLLASFPVFLVGEMSFKEAH